MTYFALHCLLFSHPGLYPYSGKCQLQEYVFILIAVIGVQAAFIYKRSSEKHQEAIIFHKSQNSLIGIKTKNDLKIFNHLDTTAISQNLIKNYSTVPGLKTINDFPLKNFFEIGGKKLLLIDSSGIYNISGFPPDLVLLNNSPRINFESLILDLNPEMIIADGSNYPSLIFRWKATALHKKIPFHATGEKGAFNITPSGKIPESD